jgi:hypothetical protein
VPCGPGAHSIGVLTGLDGVVLGLVMYFLVLSGFDSM